jgi:Tol biopolymer transport system component
VSSSLPDGTRLAYSSGSPPNLFIRRLDQPNATEMPGTEGSVLPFFSPDGQWVAFRTGDKMNKMSVQGGAVVVAASAGIGNYAGACWAEDGSIIMSEAVGRGLVSIPAGGGALKTLVPLAAGEFSLGLPQTLPGGKAILFTPVIAFEPDKVNIEVLRLADHHRALLVRGGTSPRYVAAPDGGYLIYVNKETLFAIRFDLDRLETRGTAIPVLNDVAYDRYVGTGQFDFSPAPLGHGTLVYRRSHGNSSQLMALTWVDPSGKREALRAKPGNYEALSVSPDGNRVALTIMAGDSAGVWVYDLARATMARLTFEQGTYDSPVWTPDGRHIVFSAFGTGILTARADGAGRPQTLVESKAVLAPGAFTPDGKVLVYNELVGANSRIWTATVEDAGGQLKVGKAEPFQEEGYRWADGISPDGRWLAYISSESGNLEVYVRAFPPLSGQGGKWQISNGNARASYWARNGHDLLYRTGDRIMAARYSGQVDTFAAETPRVWLDHVGGTNWTLARDDKRALVFAPVESAAASKPEHEVVFLLNFTDELRRRVAR